MTDHQRAASRLRPLLSSVVLRTQTDHRLATLAGEGHQQAFAAIFERYGRELRSHAARVVRPDGVDDVVQQAMLGSWAALLSGAEVVDLRAWLHRIVHNAALSAVTRRGYDDVELPATSVAPALTEELAHGRLTIADALAVITALPESQKRALTLTAIEGRSGRAAAQEMGVSENAMRQLVHRARSGVRSAMSSLTPLPLLGWVANVGDGAGPAVVGTGAAGGLAVGAVKLAAVIGVTGAALGGAHVLQAQHHGRSTVAPGHAQSAPAATAVTAGSGSAGATRPTSLRLGLAPDPGQVQPVSLGAPSGGRVIANRDTNAGGSHGSGAQAGGSNRTRGGSDATHHADDGHNSDGTSPHAGQPRVDGSSPRDAASHSDGARSGDRARRPDGSTPGDGAQPADSTSTSSTASYSEGHGSTSAPPPGASPEAHSAPAATTDVQGSPTTSSTSVPSPTSASSAVPSGTD